MRRNLPITDMAGRLTRVRTGISDVHNDLAQHNMQVFRVDGEDRSLAELDAVELRRLGQGYASEQADDYEEKHYRLSA